METQLKDEQVDKKIRNIYLDIKQSSYKACTLKDILPEFQVKVWNFQLLAKKTRKEFDSNQINMKLGVLFF